MSAALQVLAASAGLTAFAALIGGVMLWLRFNGLELPADRAVEMLPQSMLLTVGVHAIAMPVILGAALALAGGLMWQFSAEPSTREVNRPTGAGFAFDLARVLSVVVLGAVGIFLLQLDDSGSVPRGVVVVAGLACVAGAVLVAILMARWLGARASADTRRGKAQSIGTDLRQALGLAVIVGFAAFALIQIDGLAVLPYWPVVITALILAVAAISRAVETATSYLRIGWTVFAAVVIVGGVLAAVRTWATPKLEPVAVLLDGKPDGVSGFLIDQTDQYVYLAPLPGSGDSLDPFADADVDRILEVPRDKVLRLAVRAPAGIESDQAGREQAQSLLADLRVQQAAEAPGEVEPVRTKDPVARFAPLVHLHSAERYWPISVDDFLASSWLMWRHDRCADYSVEDRDHVGDRDEAFIERVVGHIDPARLGDPPRPPTTPNPYAHTAARGCEEIGERRTSIEHTRPHDEDGRPAVLVAREGFYIELEKGKLAGAKDAVIDEGAQRRFAGVPVYYERHPDPTGGPEGERITYWFFYANSKPPGTGALPIAHQGDWERISVLIAPGSRRNRWVPFSARYHYHHESRDVPWTAVRRVAEGSDEPTHPVVYSAKGSHASFARAGSYDATLRTGDKDIVTVHDEAIACPDCPVWRTWAVLENALEQPWYGFGGAWGATGESKDMTGPLGPSPYKIAGLEEPSAKAIEVVRDEDGEDQSEDDEEEDEGGGDGPVVSIGDSIASGEGVPDVPATALRPADWQGGVSDAASRRSADRCHRSNHAANAVAANEVLGDEERNRFVSLACSGAKIDVGLVDRYDGVQPDGSREPAQLDRLREIGGEREIAAVLVSIGANDIGFSKIVRFCMFQRGGPCQDSDDFPDPANPDRRLSLRGYIPIALDRLAAGYRTLATELRDVIDPKRVIISEYFDPTSPPPGYANPIGCEMLAGGVTPEESRWAREDVLHELNAEIARSARIHGWTLVETVDERFAGHGLCARGGDRWVTTFRESVTGQGIPLLGNQTLLASLRDLFASHTGTLHPNRAGHREIAALIEPKLQDAVEEADSD